jgi:hypothetical protein
VAAVLGDAAASNREEAALVVSNAVATSLLGNATSTWLRDALFLCDAVAAVLDSAAAPSWEEAAFVASNAVATSLLGNATST